MFTQYTYKIFFFFFFFFPETVSSHYGSKLSWHYLARSGFKLYAFLPGAPPQCWD